MCRKLTVLIFVVFMLGLVSNAPAAELPGGEYPGRHMELKVDFGNSNHAPDGRTWKDGWLMWASWNDADRHDAKLFANIGGTTIDACISVGHEGDLALGEDLDVNLADEAICNSFMHYYRSPKWYYGGDPGIRPRDPCGAVLLFLTRDGGLQPGEYWLYSYHRHPADMNNMQKIEVTCNTTGRWSAVTGQYAEYGMDPIDEQWLSGDPNCHLDPCGVIQIHDNDTCDEDIPIEGGADGDPCDDANLTPSFVKFYTDGAPVLITYRQPNDRSCGVLNAFILLGPLPKTAWGPFPQNMEEDACPDANLTWHSGESVAYDTDANGHDVYFGTDLRDEFVLLDEGFEGGIDANWTPNNWSQYDANGDGNSHSGRYSAKPLSGEGTLTSIALDASDARSLEIELWLHKSEGIEDEDIELYYYDGNNWDFIADLNSLGADDVWLHYTHEVTDSQYMVSTFQIELQSDISGGEVFVDDVLVVNTWPVGAQWFIDNRDPCDYDPPGLMDFNTTYYWRVDEVNNANPNSPWRGSTWSFTTEDGKAYDPIPGDGAWSVATDANLSWTASCIATKHDVYFSTDFDAVSTGTDPNAGAGQGRKTETMCDIPILEPFTRYYWRVDEIGPTTFPKGDVWTFMTIGGVLIHYKFDGVEDANIGDAGDANLVTDSIGNVTFRKVTWRNQQPDHACLTYGPSNPLVNLTGTSAHFHPWSEDVPDEDDIEHRVGLLLDAEGPDILDLAGEAYTIEMWIRQDSFYSWKYPGGDMDFPSTGEDPNWVATLFRKYDRSYSLAIGEDGIVRYGHSGSTITSAPDPNFPVEIELGMWYHIAAVFDSTDMSEPQKLYINGEQVSGGGTSSLNPLDDDDYVGIGFRKQPTRVGPGFEQNYFDGLIDELRVTDVALNPNQFLIRGGAGQAWFPNPQSYSTDLQYDLDFLSWRPGDYVNDVNGHVLYIGTDWDDVNDANSTVHPNVGYVTLDVNICYDIPYFIYLGQTHYWRVDQVNDACEPYLWKGTIWRFTVADYIIVDDMEEYTDTAAGDKPLTSFSAGGGAYDCGYTNTTSSALGLGLPDYLAPVRDKQSMSYMYENSMDYSLGYYSEIWSNLLDPCDWTYGGVKMLALWFYGAEGNAAGDTEQMYVGVEDSTGAGSYTEVKYLLDDMNDIQIEEWQGWYIPLSDFNDVNPDLQLEDIRRLYIGFGERGNEVQGGDGYVYFDDIRLYPQTCVLTKRPPEFAKRDLNDDCIISFGDVEIMAEDWLEADVNLGVVTKPSDTNLVGWWEFDEGSGSDVYDSSGNDHNGVIETNDVDVYWVAGRGDVNYALGFEGGIVRVADANELRPTRKLTVCAWIQYFEKQNKGSRIVNKGANDKETFVLEVDREDRGSFYVRNAIKADSNAYDVNSRDRLDRGDWIHLAGTYDNTYVKFYLNGELKDTLDDPNAWGLTLSQDTNDLEIGNTLTDPGSDKSFHGLIDEVRLYDRALSAEEIAYLASDGTGLVVLQSIADIYTETPPAGVVNFKDLARLGERWFEERLYPE